MKKKTKEFLKFVVAYAMAGAIIGLTGFLLLGCGSEGETIDTSAYSDGGFSEAGTSGFSTGTGGSSGSGGTVGTDTLSGGRGEERNRDAGSAGSGPGQGGSNPDSSVDAAGGEGGAGEMEDASTEYDADSPGYGFEPGTERFDGYKVCWEADPQTGHLTVLSEDGTSCRDDMRDDYEYVGRTNETVGVCWGGLCCTLGCWDGEKCVSEPIPDDFVFDWWGRPCDEI